MPQQEPSAILRAAGVTKSTSSEHRNSNFQGTSSRLTEQGGWSKTFANLAVSDKDYGIYCKVFYPNDLPWCFFQFTFILGSHGAYRKKRKEDEGGKEKVKER